MGKTSDRKGKAKYVESDDVYSGSINKIDEHNVFLSGLAAQGIIVEDILKLQAAGISTAEDLINHSIQGKHIKGLSVDQVVTICEAAAKLPENVTSEKKRKRLNEPAEKKVKRSLLGSKGSAVGSFFKELISEGISAQVIKKLEAARINSCDDLMKYAQKSFSIRGLKELQVYEICKLAQKLVNSRRITGSDVLIKDVIDDEHDIVAKNGFLYVSGLPSDVNNMAIDKFFHGCGVPKKLKVIRVAGKCRGFAYLEYATAASIAIALSRNGGFIPPDNQISVVVGNRDMRRLGGRRQRFDADGEGGSGSSGDSVRFSGSSGGTERSVVVVDGRSYVSGRSGGRFGGRSGGRSDGSGGAGGRSGGAGRY